MKFKSMNPIGYLDCAEYRPGGQFYSVMEPDVEQGFEDHCAEMCENCGLSRGQHNDDKVCLTNQPFHTPTPLRGRGRPAKQEEKEEQQTYYWSSSYFSETFDMNGMRGPIIGRTEHHFWFPAKPDYEVPDREKRTADELFSDPTFEFYGGPDAPEGWDESKEEGKW